MLSRTGVRDNQKQRLYNAEDSLRSLHSETATRLLIDAPRVPSTNNISIEACQAYVDHLTQSAWFQRRWGRRKMRVVQKTYGKSTGGYGKIALPPWGRCESVILHEVAHELTIGARIADHGPEFAGVLLTLVEHRMGKDAAAVLRERFKTYRVRKSMALVPKPTRDVRPVANPVRLPSVAAAAKGREAWVEREEKARIKRNGTAGFALGGETFASVHRLIQAIAKAQTGERGPVATEGTETTVRGKERPVRWSVRQTHHEAVASKYWVLEMYSGGERVHSGSWSTD